LEFAAKVTNAEEVESALHRAFAPNRVNSKREFFSIEPEQAIAILKLLHTEEVTSQVQQLPTPIAPQEVSAADEYAARRPNLNFEEMGIPVGSTLIFRDNGTPLIVTTPKKVLLNGEEMSLTAATRTLLGLDYSVQPSPYWTFKGRSLRDIYNETYS
jgi:hypothetical protein